MNDRTDAQAQRVAKKFRLGCRHCDRLDFDGVDHLPPNWDDIVLVNDDVSFNEEPTDTDNCPFEWRTHHGECPVCQASRQVHPIVRQIIDRDCHVSLSDREVVKHVVSRLRDGHESFRKMAKGDRRKLIHQCMIVHRDNRQLFVDVMSGQPMRESVSASLARHQPNRGELSGRDVRHLMRCHKMTIKQLSLRMGITQKRIREVRKSGLADGDVIRDWLEAITGNDPGPVLVRYRINRIAGETECDTCGCPLLLGDSAFEHRENVFCSKVCSRKFDCN